MKNDAFCLWFPLVELSCGDITSEPIVYLQSPSFPVPTTGSLACDYDVAIQEDICAVRIDYIRVQLARKLGGVCDIDQLFILNSVDGPTTGQCGPLTGYSSMNHSHLQTYYIFKKELFILIFLI